MKAHATVRGLGVTDDIGYRFTNGEAEHGFFCRVQLRQRSFAGQRYTCCLQRVAGEFHLGGEALGAIASDCFAHFAEGGSRGLFDIGDLLGCALWIAFDQASGEFGLEHDDGESVTEDVMQIAGDAFAFGDGGELLDLFVGHAKLCVGALLPGDEDIARANDEHEKAGE